MKNILITGASGFIGNALCSRLASDSKVIGLYHRKRSVKLENIIWEQADLTNFNSAAAICEKHSPAVVVHCAGLAHQKIGAVDSATYMRVNSEATEKLAIATSRGNPAVRFIFLSSVSVYGEDNLNIPVSEDSECQPSSDYALSKLDAEKRLIALSDKGIIRDLIILRLAPVYDHDWTFNLDRRILAPLNMVYIRFGSGLQKVSALARPNLVDFIEFLINRLRQLTQITDKSIQQNNPRNLRINILNLCDAEAYEFNRVILAFKNSGIRPNRPIVSVPLPVVWLATRIAGSLSPDKREWVHSCYHKLASSLVFDNEKMLKTGFKPRHSLQTIFASTRRIENWQGVHG